MSTLDPDALATLTPEEQAAIQDSEYSADEVEAIKKIASGAAASDGEESDPEDDENDNEDDSADDPKGDKGDKGADEAKVGQDTKAGAPTQTALQDAPTVAVDAALPRYDAKLPDDFEGRVKALAEKEESVWRKFNDGEMEREALQQELRDIDRVRGELNAVRVKAEISQEMQVQSAEAARLAHEASFIARTKGDGVDYTQPRNIQLFNQLLIDVRADADGSKTEAQLWDEAHRAVLKVRGVAAVAPPPRQAPADPVQRRKPDPSVVPQTLAQVPGSDGPGDVAGEFADLDALSGDDLEAAISRMSKAQRDRYARA